MHSFFRLFFLSMTKSHTIISTEEKEEYDVTGGKAYTKTCEALGIIPATYFLRTIQVKAPSICMSHHGIGPKGAKAISVALTVSIIYYLFIEIRFV